MVKTIRQQIRQKVTGLYHNFMLPSRHGGSMKSESTDYKAFVHPQAFDSESTFLELKAIDKFYGKYHALKSVNLKISEGEFLCIVGPSGCGKTTLLRTIAGLEEQDSGSILLNGNDISTMPTSKRNCGIVFQSYALFPNLTIIQNIAYGMRKLKLRKTERHKRIHRLLKMVGLEDQSSKYPAQLSGGQQQRVALARAVATSPSILLLDEPLSALDANVRQKLRNEICQLQRKLGITTIMVTHDQKEALTMADRIIVMKDGHLVQCDSPQAIYRHPRNAFVAGFIGSMNFLPDWTHGRNNCFRYNSYMLQRLSSSLPEENNVCTLAIRPENIRLFSEEEVNASQTTNLLSAIIESVEFHGSSYHLTVKALNTHFYEHSRAILINVELSAQVARNFALNSGNHVFIQLPPEHLLVFDENIAAS